MPEIHELNTTDANGRKLTVVRGGRQYASVSFPRAVRRGARKGLVNRPFQGINTFADGMGVNARFVRPLRQSLCFAAMGQKAVVRAVILLLFHRGPTAISRLIPKTIVNAVNRVFWGRTLPHVSKERLVGIAPVRANLPGVVFRAVREAAPNLVGPRLFPAPRFPVPRPSLVRSSDFFAEITSSLKALGIRFPHQTPARSRITENKTVGWRNKLFAAIALALPHSIIQSHANASQRSQAGKFLSGQISGRWHIGAITYG